MNTTITTQVDRNGLEDYISKAINEFKFKIAVDSNPYVVSRLTGDSCTVTFYTNGKVLMQGDESMVNAVNAGLFGVPKTDDPSIDYTSHIGADEVGKGDYFGPLVVCACYVNNDALRILRDTGVADSKTKSDSNILKIYDRIKDTVSYRISILVPEEYNEQYLKYGNVAKLLSNLHMENIHSFVEELKQKGLEYNHVVIDQFSSNKERIGSLTNGLRVVQMHHAESEDIAVAAASIIARRYFLKAMDEMGEKYEIVFPKGATHVLPLAKEFVQKYGKEELINVAKVSFKTTLQI